MIKHKRLTSKSGITIPKDLRHRVGYTPGMAVDLVATGEGVLVRKHVPTCSICGSVDSVVGVHGYEICKGCVALMAEEVRKRYGG